MPMHLNPVPNVPKLDAIAISIDPIKESGRSKPLAMHCASISSPQITEYIVKLYGNLDLKQQSLARELYGSLLAYVMGFDTPDPAVINVPLRLADLAIQQKIKTDILNSPGLNFGSKTISPAITFENVPDGLFQSAVDIFAFDMLLRNPDRRVDKPNLFQNNSCFILYDHEMAFPYSFPIMYLNSLPEPWDLRGDGFIKNHIMYLPIYQKRPDCSFDNFIVKLKEISDDIFDKIQEQIPDDWQGEGVDNITAYLKKARDNADKFKKGLLEVLA